MNKKIVFAAVAALIVAMPFSGANAVESVAEMREPSAIVMPESYTDPNTIEVDNIPLVRADGNTLNWDAPPDEEQKDTAFDESTWPTNEYTEGLPLPPTGKVQLSGEDQERRNTFVIQLAGIEAEEFYAYVDALTEAGFDKNAAKEDYSQYGMDGMSYTADGPGGRTITATGIFTMETTAIIEISK